MKKIFLRTGAFYQSETKSLSDDLELSELLNIPVTETPKETVVCNCKSELSELKKRVDDLTNLLTTKTKDMFSEENLIYSLKEETASEHNLSSFNDDKPASVTSKKMVTKKAVAKKK